MMQKHSTRLCFWRSALDRTCARDERADCDSKDSISTRDEYTGGMFCRHYIKDVGLNGFAVGVARRQVRGWAGGVVSCGRHMPVLSARRTTTMTPLRKRMIDDMVLGRPRAERPGRLYPRRSRPCRPL